jgi:hypothetical protein
MWLFACTTEPVPPADLSLPEPGDLPALAAPPDPFVQWADGAVVNHPAEWDARRAELLTLFAAYEYGAGPALPEVDVVVERDEPAMRELTVTFAGGALGLLVLVPPGPGPHPVLLGPNKCGNETVAAGLGVAPTTSWVEDGCVPGQDPGWATDEVLDRGVALATWHQSDVQPDDPGDPGLRAVLDPGVPAERAWGAVAAWSYGDVAAAAALREVPDLGPIAVWGHSRRGKAALWAAALDPRIDGVWAHQSGTGGAALARSLAGEPIGAMNLLFPHWFPAWFHAFADREVHLPFDQHLLLATVAPRPLRITDGADDAWADPAGADQAVALAEPVFAFLGGAPPVREVRPGGHEVLPEDLAAAAAWWASVSP